MKVPFKGLINAVSQASLRYAGGIKMIKPEYKRELSHSYLILENIPKDKMDNYQCRMILKNKIPGLLCSSERYINGKACLYYDISSRQSLDQLYEAGKLSFAEILGIVDGLARVLENMSGFLLEEQNLLLDPGYMYLDLDTQQLCLLYYPFAEKENPIGSIYMPIAEFFLEHVDHKEEKAVSAAYQFYKMSKAESFRIESFRCIWEKNESAGQEEGTAGYAGETFPGEDGYSEWGAESDDHQGLFYEEPGLYTYNTEYDGSKLSFLDIDEDNDTGEYVNKGIAEKRITEKRISDKRISEKRTAEKKAADKRTTGKRTADKTVTEKRAEKKAAGREIADAAESEKSAEKLRRLNLTGLGAASLAFGILCMVIWYLQPENLLKTVLFGLLALDGITLLVFLWRLTVKKEPKEEKREEMKDADTWESFDWLPEYGEDSKMVFLGEPGCNQGNPGQQKKGKPRLRGEVEGKEISYRLEPLPMIAGKLRNRVQLLLPDASVSRIHARLVEKEGRVALMDLNSANGTYINGIRLEQNESMVLEKGDEIRFGDMIFQYEE